jgi:hypothetical protein
MFNFLDDTKPLLTKRGIPLAIYWGASVLGFVLLMVVLFLLHNRAMQKEKPADKNEGKLGEQSHKANGINGKSTGTDGSSQRGSKSPTGWFRKGRVALCGDGHV